MSKKPGAPEGLLAARQRVEQDPQRLRALSQCTLGLMPFERTVSTPVGRLPVSWNMPSARMHCADSVECVPVQADGVTKLSNPRNE